MLKWVDCELLIDDGMLAPLISKQVNLFIPNTNIEYNNSKTAMAHTNAFAGVAGAPYFWLNSANNSLSIRSCMGRMVSGQTDL